jgi:ribosomal protein S25
MTSERQEKAIKNLQEEMILRGFSNETKKVIYVIARSF